MGIRKITIADKIIGDGKPCFITAEAGSNHNGSLDQARKLIDIAAASGADAVKFQLFHASTQYPKNAGYADYLKNRKPIYDIIKDMEMPHEWIPELAAHCKKRGIIFFSAVCDEESVDMLDEFVPCFKLASYEATHIPLIKYVAEKGKPIILSVGVATIKEISEALETAYSAGNMDVVLQNSVSCYPAPIKDTNLKVVQTLKKKFRIPVGVSDHTRDPLIVPVGAVAFGANLIEKHFTISNNLPGPDHMFAIEPDELNSLVHEIRSYEKHPVGVANLINRFPLLKAAIGDGRKRVMPSERELYKFARRSVFSIRPIEKGMTFTKKNIAVLRNGKNTPGLHPREFIKIVGRKAAKDIPVFKSIRKGDLS